MVQQISALIVQPTLDASKYTPGAQEKVAADKAMAASSREAGAAAVDTSAKINQSGDVLARLSRQYVDGYAAEQRFAQGLNQLNRGLETGKISMEGAERILIGMNQRLGLAGDAAQLAAKGQNELAAAVTRANAQIERQATELLEAEAASRRFQAANTNTVTHGARQAAGFNAGQQLQDIAMMSVLGQSPGMLAMQQGPQLATAIQQGGGLAALGAGLGSLLSVTTLLTIGFTAATAATIQWFMKGKDGAKSFNEALKAHSDALRLLKDDYGQLGEAAKNATGIAGIAFTDATARNAQASIEAQLRTKAGPFLDQMGGNGLWAKIFGNGIGPEGLRDLSGGQKQFAAPVAALLEEVRKGNSQGGLEKFREDVEALYSTLVGKSDAPMALRATADAVELLGENAFAVSGKFAPFADQINRLKVEGAKGLANFNAEVEAIGRNKGLQNIADEAIVAGKEIVDLAQKAADLEKIIRRLEAGKRGPLIGSSAEDDRNSYLDAQRLSLRSAQRMFDADMAALGAKSPQELAAAARTREAARDIDGESADVRSQRIDLAGKRALLEAEHSLTEARQQRTRAIASSLDQQRLQLDVIGKTGGEQAKLTYEFERMQELREQAARTGEPIDQKEVANIKAAAEAMGMYADALARAKMGDDLSFESDQLRRTSQDQQIAARQRGAGLPVDLNSPLAQQMRDNQYYSDAKDSASGFVRTFGDELINSGGDIGKSLGKAIQNALLDATSKAWERLADQIGIAFANWLTGSSGKGAGSGAFGTASGFADMLFGKGGANDNYAAPAGTVTRAPLAGIGMSAYRDAIGSIESAGSGGYSALGPIHKTLGQALGRYQIMEANLPAWSQAALGRSVGRSEFMGSPALQDAIFDNRFGSYVDKYGASGAASMWFTGRPSAPNATDVLGTTGSAYVDKFNKALGKAGENLNTFGGGLGKLGNALNQFPAAPSGGGGGLLGSLFGGLSSTFSGTKAFSWLSANPGGYIGLYHDGGIAGSPTQMRYAPHSLFRNAPRFHEGTLAADEVPAILRRGEPVFKSMDHARRVVGANSNSSTPQKVDLHVNVYGGSGDDHVRMLAKQGAQEAIGQYNEAQTRGGFGEMQRRFASQKG